MHQITLRAGLERKSFASRACAAVKLHARALASPRLTMGWLDVLNSHPALANIAELQPRLLHKIYRPYLSNRLNSSERLSALASHYRFILQHDLAGLTARAIQGGVELAAFAGKSGAHYTVVLHAIVPMEREGELVLQLRCNNALVQSVAFSFFFDGVQASIGIGCLQGPQCGAGLELARNATRDLHGLRPKNLLVRLVHQLGFAYGCSQMLMVGNDNRPVRKQLRKGRVHADYDVFWQEMGATQRSDGDYALRCIPLAAPDLEQIPSKKRAEARRRHDLLCDVVAMVLAGMTQPRMAAAPASAPAMPLLVDAANTAVLAAA
ncbi:VirK/YbjX family protein [Pseudoduganella ginsengisoli]|uniref:DUF535 domain-containing protein n=1 Tax=Pseudoduganella ginsengisoli TaxID=1462440 RepID=A0A6L6PTM2_9BURK|nr:DUF535 family protein [Pseudoduganella ginsengisoli]MTW00787.1 DUF535 domain-containing protein [Pseudoduganella ginsengisoli]